MRDIVAAAPLGAAAENVIGTPSRPFRFDPGANLRPGEVIWTECPPLKRLDRRHDGNPEYIDYTGVRCGRLVIVGVDASCARWIARCDCGRFCPRQTSTIKKFLREKDSREFMCPCCERLQHLKYLDSERRKPIERRIRAVVHDIYPQLKDDESFDDVLREAIKVIAEAADHFAKGATNADARGV